MGHIRSLGPQRLQSRQFSDGTINSGNYIGLRSDDFAHCLAWVHVKSSNVIASMNDS